MALSPLLLAERRRRGVCKKAESVPDRPLALCGGSGAALANPAPAKPLTASTYQPESLGPDRAPGLRPNHMQVILERASGPLADPYRTGHGRPLGSPISNSLETPCLAPSEGNMALSPLLLAERRHRGV